MPQFRKKPVVIEAVQWFPNTDHSGVHRRDDGPRDFVITAHGQRAYLTPGDWIISEDQEGRFYPCRPDIFAATYDPVADPAAAREARRLADRDDWPEPAIDKDGGLGEAIRAL